MVIRCPADCIGGVNASADFVYGDVIYHWDSSLCLAAIHAGAVKNNDGGEFLFSFLNGVAKYESTVKNNVTSQTIGGNLNQYEQAFMTRPYHVDSSKVEVESTRTNEIQVTSWAEVDNG